MQILVPPQYEGWDSPCHPKNPASCIHASQSSRVRSSMPSVAFSLAQGPLARLSLRFTDVFSPLPDNSRSSISSSAIMSVIVEEMVLDMDSTAVVRAGTLAL